MSDFTFPNRTIQHPGYEFFERDYIPHKDGQNDINGLFFGFASQGPIGYPVKINNTGDFIKYFGTPESEAEYYLYKGVDEYVNSNDKNNPFATVIRLPYDNDLCDIKEFTQRFKAIRYKIKTDNSGLGDYKELFEKDINFKNLLADETILITAEELKAFEEQTTDDFIVYNKFNSPLKNGEEIFISVIGRGNVLSHQGFINKPSIDIFNYSEFNCVNENTIGKHQYEWDYSVIENINSNLLKCIPQIKTLLKKDLTTGFYNRFISQTNNEENITIIVSKVSRSPILKSKFKIELLEVFSGSIFSDSIDTISRESNYIGDIINSNSEYIGFAGHKTYKGFKRGYDELFVRDQIPLRIAISKQGELNKFILKRENTLASSWIQTDHPGGSVISRINIGYSTKNPVLFGSEWNIKHNLKSKSVLVQVVNLTNNNIIVYNDIQIVDENNIVIRFNYDGPIPNNLFEVIIIKNDLDGYTEIGNNLVPENEEINWVINHGLNSEKLLVQLFDESGHQIITETFINDAETVTVKLYSDKPLSNFKAVILNTEMVEDCNYSIHNPILKPNNGVVTWKINHNLDTNKIIVQIMDNETNEIFNSDIYIINDNEIEVRLNVEHTKFENGVNPNQFKVSLAGFLSDIIEEIDYSTVILPIVLKEVSNYTENTFSDIFDCGSSSVIALATKDENGNMVYNPEYAGKIIDSEKRWLNFARQIGKFCKYANPYCMAHLDAPKNLTLTGQISLTADLLNDDDKVISAEKLLNIQIQDNSYLDINVTWLEIENEFIKYKHYIPSSCKFARCIGALEEPWHVPAGRDNGLITGVSKASIIPEPDTKDRLYSSGFNYVSMINGQICYFDGQKTCWNKDYQLNRINVRRLINHLKRYTINVGKSYVGETNNAPTRENLKNDLSQEFERCKLLGALDSYSIDVGADINSELVIKDGEVRVQIIVKPVSCIEFVLACFTIYRTGVSMMNDAGLLTDVQQ